MDMLLLRINATSLPTGDVTSSNCLGTEPGSIDSPRGRLCECLAMVEVLLLSVSCLPTMPAQRLMAFASSTYTTTGSSRQTIHLHALLCDI